MKRKRSGIASQKLTYRNVRESSSTTTQSRKFNIFYGNERDRAVAVEEDKRLIRIKEISLD